MCAMQLFAAWSRLASLKLDSANRTSLTILRHLVRDRDINGVEQLSSVWFGCSCRFVPVSNVAYRVRQFCRVASKSTGLVASFDTCWCDRVVLNHSDEACFSPTPMRQRLVSAPHPFTPMRPHLFHPFSPSCFVVLIFFFYGFGNYVWQHTIPPSRGAVLGKA